MQAIVFTEYGEPDRLHLQEVALPTPAADEVRIAVHAASVNSWDWDLLHGRPFINRLLFGLTRPKSVQILGADVAGRVDAVGANVTQFQPGDALFGDLSAAKWGGFAEAVCARADLLARIPEGVTFTQAAAIPQAGVLALQGLRQGGLAQGQKVLLNGAGGGVGTFALQLAKAAGAEVTAVDRAEKLAGLTALGADHVIDYTQQDFTRNGQVYDLILDVVAARSVFAIRRALAPAGHYIVVGGTTPVIFQVLLLGSLLSRIGSRKLRLLFHQPNARDLDELVAQVKAGALTPIIDRTYPLRETPEAVRHLGEGRQVGKVVIVVRT